MKKLILASNSPRRRELLEQIGVEFEVIPSNAEEKVTKQEPSEVVEELSRQKAEDVAAAVEDGIVLGQIPLYVRMARSWASQRMRRTRSRCCRSCRARSIPFIPE